jgi:hypothetical protein
MAQPVIVDDGGSTRIKQIKGDDADGKLDDLLSPAHGDDAKGSFSKMTIRFFSKNGAPGGPIDADLDSGDAISIVSANKQQVSLDVGNNGRVFISLKATVDGVEPLVHGKQNGDQRRYVVSNAGSIEQVTIKKGGVTTSVFNAADPNKAENGDVYTMVVLT